MSGKVKKEEGGEATPRTGPRGGTTTVARSGLVKKNLWIAAEMGEWLRWAAFHERKTEAWIVRLGLQVVKEHYEETGQWPKA
jgi:hypothetical protein